MYNQAAKLESLIQSVNNLLSIEIDVDAQAVDSLLSKIISESSSLNTTARLRCGPVLLRFVNISSDLLGNASIRPMIRSKILLILSNLCFYNISLRKNAASKRTCQAICRCLALAVEEQMGPQNKIDILRLLQIITYGKVEFGDWIQNFLPFLTTEILNDSPSELLPYCMCILSNLVSQSRSLIGNLKEMDLLKRICIQILQLLSHDSKAIVISALVLVGYLDERTRDTVYSSQNLSQTFLCIFNILNTPSPDALITTHIAVDLLKRLVICQPKTPNDSPTLRDTARNLSSYSFFEKSIQKLSSLLNMLDPHSEESRKISKLLLSFCQIDELRQHICLAIAAIETNEIKLNTPCHALLRSARLTFEEAIFPEVPLTSLQLLNYITKEVLNSGQSIRKLFCPINSIFILIHEILNGTNIDTNSPLASFQATKIAEGLKLGEAISNDEEIRFELLEWIGASQCSAIFEQQLCTNPVGYTFSSSTSIPDLKILDQCEDNITNSKEILNIPLWSINAVSIPIQLLRLVASFKDYSKPHKELYWRSLKDARLLPFVAYAIARGDHELIYDAFILLTHCSQVHEFPLKKLSKLTSKCASFRRKKHRMQSKNIAEFLSSPEESYEIPTTNNIQNGDEPKMERIVELMQIIASLKRRLAEKEHIPAIIVEKSNLPLLETERNKVKLAEEKNKLLEEENERERSLHSILRGKFDEMTRKFDTAAKVAFEKQIELENLSTTNKAQETRLLAKEEEMEEARKTISEQRSKLEAQANEIEAIRAENRQLNELKQAMARLLNP